jgi:hypothetical protein
MVIPSTIEKVSFVKDSMFSSKLNTHYHKSKDVWPLRAYWFWMDSKCNVREKVLEWRFPFEFETHVETFFNATVSGDFSSLPNPLSTGFVERYYDIDGILIKNLGLSKKELEHVSLIKLEDLPNGWEFIIKSNVSPSQNLRWFENGLGHDRKIESF